MLAEVREFFRREIEGDGRLLDTADDGAFRKARFNEFDNGVLC